jgi:cyclophilin family peptidyl-prolyl cis-trans isomerase
MCPSKSHRKVARRKSHTSAWIALTLIIVFVVSIGVYIVVANQPPAPIPPTKVLLQTTAGNITIDLRTDKPITSTNFINLVKAGRYDGTTFHRIVAGFMIQGGQVNGDVATIKDEIGSNNRNTPYTIAMAKKPAPDSATSEFFINVADNGARYSSSDFDGTYTVFGTIISGQDVVDTIANAPATENPYIPGEISVPVNPVTIIKASIIP